MKRALQLAVLLVLVVQALLSSNGSGSAASNLDSLSKFQELASQGFKLGVDGPHADGSTHNNYAWAMGWFGNKLYVGTARDVACFGTAPGPLCPPATDVGNGIFIPNVASRAEIWQFSPTGNGTTGTWKRVYQSPVVNYLTGQTPQYLGFRNAVVCNAGDGKQRLYFATFGIGGRVIYTENGTTFKEASTIGLNLASDMGLRPLVCFKPPNSTYSHLYTSPVGTPDDNDVSNNPVVLDIANPLTGAWQKISAPGFGNKNNLSVFTMQTWDADNNGTPEYLVAGTLNRATGFELWITTAACTPSSNGAPVGGLFGRIKRNFGGFSSIAPSTTAPCMPTWQKVLDRGAGRPTVEPFADVLTAAFPTRSPDLPGSDAGVASMTGWRGNLYIGSSDAQNSDGGPAELIRVRPNLTWDLIIGYARVPSSMTSFPNFNCAHVTIQSGDYCGPLSGRSAGAGPLSYDVGGSYGTVGAGIIPGKNIYLWAMTPHTDGYLYVGTLGRSGNRGIPGAVPGSALLRSLDGVNWSIVDETGFGNADNGGIRNMVSTSMGLFIGTANRELSLPNGGLEVWFGPN